MDLSQPSRNPPGRAFPPARPGALLSNGVRQRLYGDPPAGPVPVRADFHDKLARHAGTAGQRPGDLKQPPFGHGGPPPGLLDAPGMLPAVEDLGDAPGDAELEVLDALGFQSRAAGGWRRIEGDPGWDTGSSVVHPFDYLIRSGGSRKADRRPNPARPDKSGES